MMMLVDDGEREFGVVSAAVDVAVKAGEVEA